MGIFEGGKAHGVGRMIYSDGNVYEGEWSNDRYYGEGKYTHAQSGAVYVGDFMMGVRSG